MKRFLVIIFSLFIASEAAKASDIFVGSINISNEDILKMTDSWGEIKDLCFLKNDKKIDPYLESINNKEISPGLENANINPYGQLDVQIKPAKKERFNVFSDTLLKSPYKYDLLIGGLKSDEQINIDLVYSNNISKVIKNGIIIIKSKVVDGNYLVRIEFQVCSFKNNKRHFKLLIKDYDGEVLFSSDKFYIHSRKR